MIYIIFLQYNYYTMENDFQQLPFYKALMAGLFAGIIAATLCLVFNIVYREYTSFPLSIIINVSSIIFIVTLVLTLAGIAYFGISRLFQRGSMITYMTLFLALTLLCVRYAVHVQRSTDPVLSSEFSGLFEGIIIISGLFAIFFIPYLIKTRSNII